MIRARLPGTMSAAHDPELLTPRDRHALACCAALFVYALGASTLAGGAPRGVCAALTLPVIALLVAGAWQLPRERARGLLVRSLVLGALGVVAADLSSGLTYAAATQRGHLIRLLWGGLAALVIRTCAEPLVPDDALRAGWRRLCERSYGLRSALAAWALSVVGGSAILGWLVGHYPWGPDVGVHVTDAMRVASGSVPYVDFYTLYHAGNLYLQAAWLALFGPLSSATLGAQVVVQHAWIATCLAVVLRVRLGLGGWALALAIAGYFFFVPALEGMFLILEPMSSCSGWAALALASLLGRRLRTASAPAAAALAGGLLVGLLATMALATKQVGGVFLAALPLVHLDAGRLVRPVLVAQLGGAALLPAGFFLAHPEALAPYWQQCVLGLFSYAQGTLTASEPAWFVVHHLARNALLPLALAGALGLCSFELRRGGGPRPWGDVLLLSAGAATGLPSFIRPYLHYYLFPLPFAVFAVALVVRRGAPLWSAPWQLTVALGLLIFGVTPIVHYHEQTFGRDVGAGHERAVETFIRERAGGRDRVLILPSSPQYYLRAGTSPPDGVYMFVTNEADLARAGGQFQLAREGALPAFLVDRGDRMLDACRARLRELGFVRRAEGPNVEHWACD